MNMGHFLNSYVKNDRRAVGFFDFLWIASQKNSDHRPVGKILDEILVHN